MGGTAWWQEASAAACGVAVASILGLTCIRLFGRQAARWLFTSLLQRIFTDPYHENLWETVTGVRRVGAQGVIETQLRAASGHPPSRPFGRFRGFPGFDALLFSPAQLQRLPTPETVPVGMSVVLGPRAARPLCIAIPILITGMGYAVALSAATKRALALGASRAGTATNTGMGPFLPEERAAARQLIIQYNRGVWTKDPGDLRQADMIEIQFGQGAWGGSALPVEADGFPPALRRTLGIAPSASRAWVHARHAGFRTGRDLRALAVELREIAPDVPLGVKIAAGDSLEADLDLALGADVDVVTVDGAEGGTQGAPALLADDFGLPTFLAVCRATRFLAGIPRGDRPSLVVSGGLFTPGHFLKALALGADAVAIGTAALFAAGHDQTAIALPWEPPLDIMWYGRPAARRFDPEKGAAALHRFLRAAIEEMEMGVRALGKAAVAAVDRGDLCALEPWAADAAGVRLAVTPRAAASGWAGIHGAQVALAGELKRLTGALQEAEAVLAGGAHGGADGAAHRAWNASVGAIRPEAVPAPPRAGARRR